MSVRWTAELRDDGALAFRVGRDGDSLVAEWPGLARLVVSEDGRSYELVPARKAAKAAFDKLSRGLAAALVRHVRGEMSLHASAVRIGASAVILTGPSGAGKSTLAAMLCRRGAALLADDIAALDERADGAFFVPPTEREHALDGASRELVGILGATRDLDGDKRLCASAPAPAPVPMSMIVTLAWSDDGASATSLTPLRGAAALGALVSAIPRLVVDDAQRNALELSRLGRLCARVPVVSLVRPRGAVALAESASQVETRTRALEAAGERETR